MTGIGHPAVSARAALQPKARPATVRARLAAIWARRLRGPGGTSMFFLRRMLADNILNTSAALCYSTALGVVPALALVFGTMTAFPAFDRVRQQVQDTITANLLPDTGMRFQEGLTHFIAAAGKLTVFGIAGLAVTAILLLLTIEGAFSGIFRVAHPRPLLLRLVVLWAVLTIAPFFTALVASLFGVFSTLFGDHGVLSMVLFGHVLPTLIIWGALTLLYRGIPNRPVKIQDAAIGAGLAALLVEMLRIGFTLFVRRSAYGAIYGAVAAVPVFLLWVFCLWTAVLAGAVVAAALPDWRLLRSGHGSGPGLKLALGLAIIDLLAGSFRKGGGLTPEAISDAVAVPPAGVMPVLEELHRARFVAVTEKGMWLLSRDLAQTPFVDLVHRFGLGVGPAVLELRGTPLGDRVCPYLEPAARSERELLGVCLDDLLRRRDDPDDATAGAAAAPAFSYEVPNGP